MPATEFAAESVEAIVAKDLALGSLLDGASPPRTDEQHQLTTRRAAQESLDQRGAEKASGAGDEDALAAEGIGDHVSTVARLYHLVEMAANTATHRPTRQRVLDAALASFSGRGYEATSLDDLAAALGIRKQTILYYHPSKEALLGAVVDEAAATLADAFAATVARAQTRAGTRDVNERVTAVVDAVFRLGAERPELLALLWEVVRLGPPASSRLAERLAPLLDDVVVFLAQGRSKRPTKRAVAAVRQTVVALSARVVGLAVEVDLLQSLGTPPNLAWLRKRRRELIADFGEL